MSDFNCPPNTNYSSPEELRPLADLFKALGHPIRVMIVEMLMHGERCVCELQQGSGRDMSTTSSHLNILKNNKIVTCEQRGKNVYYMLACPCLINIFSCLKSKSTL